jgi:hypothetical protein
MLTGSLSACVSWSWRAPKLKRLLAETHLDMHALKSVLG